MKNKNNLLILMGVITWFQVLNRSMTKHIETIYFIK